MHNLGSLNGRLTELAEATLAAPGFASIYGKGIFTTIAIRDQTPFLWDKHWRRLNYHAQRIAVDISMFPAEATHTALETLLKANGVTSGRARITFFDESPSGLWPYDAERRTSLLIMTGEANAGSDSTRLTTSPYVVNTSSPLAGIKCCNYLEKLIAQKEANARGFDECIQLNERGEIVSASMANVFWVKDQRFYTPSLDTGCLAGTTREFILENLDCEEVAKGVETLQDADDVFLTSAGLGVVRVAEYDGRALRGERHAIEELLPAL